MNISELTPRQGNVEVEGTITEVGETKTFRKFDKDLKVSDAILKDDSGTVKLTLWNDDAERFKAGDKIKVVNGYVNEFQGEMQLTAGKFGSLEKVGEGEAPTEGVSGDAGEPVSEETTPEAESSPSTEESESAPEEDKSEESIEPAEEVI